MKTIKNIIDRINKWEENLPLSENEKMVIFLVISETLIFIFIVLPLAFKNLI